MIIWSGFGFLIPIIGIVAIVLTEKLGQLVCGVDNFFGTHTWGIALAMLMAALLTFGLHKLLMKIKPKIVIDKESGEEIELRGSHSLFFVPILWWVPVFVVLAIALGYIELT